MKFKTTLLLLFSACFVLLLTIIYNQQIQINLLNQRQNITTPPPAVTPTLTQKPIGTVTYKSDLYHYEIELPKTWEIVPHSSNFQYISSWQASDKSIFEIQVYDSEGLTLAQYLKKLDLASQTGYEGKPSKKILTSDTSKVGLYDSITRKETWLAAGFDVMSVYAKADNKIYIFSVLPDGSREPSTTLVGRSFPQIVSSFKLNVD